MKQSAFNRCGPHSLLKVSPENRTGHIHGDNSMEKETGNSTYMYYDYDDEEDDDDVGS